MFWLSPLQKFLKALNDNTSPNQLAAGVALGAVIGLLPQANLLAAGLWMLAVLFNIHLGLAMLSAMAFGLLGALTDPFVERVGFYLLTGIPALKPLWTTLYNTPVIPFTAFNHTLVMGNFAAGILLVVPLFVGFRMFVVAYRQRLRDRILKWKVVQAIKATKAADWIIRWLNL